MSISFATVAGAFEASATRWADLAFIEVLPETSTAYGIAAGALPYASAQQRVSALRTAYARAGYGAGHRVGLLLDNRPAFFLHWFALNGLGASVVPISADLRAAELEYLVAHSEIALAVAVPQRHAELRAAAAAAGRPLAVIADSDVPPDAAFAVSHAPPDELNECALLYTSGTTGRPKGCILQNRYFLHAGRWYLGVGGLCELRAGQERMLTPLPVAHMNAMAFSTLAMVLSGGCLMLLDRFHPGTWWNTARESRATLVHNLGVMPSMLMKAAPSSEDTRHAVRFGFGAGVDKALQAPFEARFGFPLLDCWAMTETGAGAVIMANAEPRCVGTNCFGRESENVLVRVVDDEGQEAGAGEPGELLVRRAGADARYGFFAGYLKDAQATDEAWQGGWFHTGDIVSRDAQGLLHFIDRRKNVIRRSGENISAVEVESVLSQLPEVKACAVAATPDELRGDEVLACIVTHEPVPEAEREPLARRVVAHALDRLAYYKAPGYVAFVDALPLTPSQKIHRGELKAMSLALPGQPHCIDTRPMKKRQT